MKIAIASDHAGFPLKEEIKKYLETSGKFSIQDLGTDSSDPVDYPDYASEVAMKVSMTEVERGVLVCGSGIGMCITANRYENVRAVVLREACDAEMSRRHNNSNIACLGARITNFEKCRELLDLWFATPFEAGRHSARIDKIERHR